MTHESATAPLKERPAFSVNGWPVLIGGLVVLALSLWGVIDAAVRAESGGSFPASGVVALIVMALDILVLVGLTPIAPGRARVIQLLGRYTGTVRIQGLRWVNPLTTRRTISTRIRNHETESSKVNDAAGNPIEIAAVVVWQVTDTAEAMFAVDDFVEFVMVQTESAVRHIANSYPYDNTSANDGLSLRDNADEITARLSAEVSQRVIPAGVTVLESRITRLAYAPEIAQAMLRRQQADAVVAARARIVEGAVGMVEQALARLEGDSVVTLDDEQRAGMVANLMVVLCSEQGAQPIVNAGSGG